MPEEEQEKENHFQEFKTEISRKIQYSHECGMMILKC
jgi:hypothetical protein